MHDKIKSRSRRDIPSVNKILDLLGRTAEVSPNELSRPLLVNVVRRELEKLRRDRSVPSINEIVLRIRAEAGALHAKRLQPVINGTGILVHTNFGRAPIAAAARRAIADAAAYNNLEYDVAAAARGDRGYYVEEGLAHLSGAEAATVVNNCAAALFLIPHHFVRASKVAQPEVIISRGELVQIGGGFRIGEILEASGAKLREVGATNKTTLSDYARAISDHTALILKVHRSNFFMGGFVDSPETSEIAGLAKKKRIPFAEDLGSGALIATEQIGLHEHEPMPNESIRAGADLVCFSGDKLLGGPQAGIIAGRKKLIARLKKEPIFRALRCDKLAFAALQATIDLHLNGSISEIPIIALLQTPKDELRARAATIIERLRGLPLQTTIGRGVAKIGGGALPRSIISSVAIDIVPQNCSVSVFSEFLRQFSPPVVGYISNHRFKLDLRTIFSEQDETVVDAIRDACAKSHQEC